MRSSEQRSENAPTAPAPGEWCDTHEGWMCGYGFGACQGITYAMLIAAAINGDSE